MNLIELAQYKLTLQQALQQKFSNILEFKMHDIEVAFKTPDLNRKDGDVQSWQYATDNCVLDLFWMNGTSSVEHYEVRQSKEGTSTACSQRFLK